MHDGKPRSLLPVVRLVVVVALAVAHGLAFAACDSGDGVPAALTIDAGDTVIFSNSDRDFHNAVFVPEGQTAPPFPIIRRVEGRTGFRLIINPESEREIPPPENFGPDDMFSSGIMGITFPRFQWAVTFENPGTYRFECTIHVLSGMAGVITVQ